MNSSAKLFSPNSSTMLPRVCSPSPSSHCCSSWLTENCPRVSWRSVSPSILTCRPGPGRSGLGFDLVAEHSLRVLIAGGGVAELESLLPLRPLARDHPHVMLVAPE